MPFLSLIIYRFSKAFLAGAMNMDRISFIAKTQRRWCKIRHVVSHMSSQSDGTASNQFGANQSTNQMDGKLQQPITRQQSWYNNCVVNFPPFELQRKWRSVCAQLFTELWRRKERLFVPHFYVVHKKVILFLRMTKRWRTFYPKVSVRAAKEAHKEKMIAFHSTKSGKQVCLQLNPRTSLVSFIWSFFASNPQTISQK